jgi:hypothetical protein
LYLDGNKWYVCSMCIFWNVNWYVNMEAFLAGWPGQTHGTWLESRAARTWAPTTKATRCLLAPLPRTPWATGYHPMILIRLFKTDFLVAWKVNNLFVFTRALTHYFLLESERLFLVVYYMRMISQPLDGCVCLDQSPLAQTYLSLSILCGSHLHLLPCWRQYIFIFYSLSACKRHIFNAVSFAVMREDSWDFDGNFRTYYRYDNI